MAIDNRKLDRLRSGQSELENHYVDELIAGRLDRRTFLRRGAVLGMSASAAGALLAACGGANGTGGEAGVSSPSAGSSASTTSAPVTKGGTLKLANPTPATAMNPLLVNDAGGGCLIAQTGEFLTFDNNLTLQLEPMLAAKWTHNGDGSAWTFKLRSGVKFHNGKPLTADDVVYTFQQLADKKNASNALSTFAGVLTPDGVKAVDSHTVAFHLEAPNGNFPYLVSSDNYNAIIVPKGTDFAKWGKTFIGTGPFKLKSYSTNQSAEFIANPSYWGGPPHLDRTVFTFYASQQPQIVALQGGSVDVIIAFVPSGAQTILSNSGQYSILKYKSSQHRELSMRCDQEPFTDPRVRQAIAYSLDRPAMVQALLQGYGQVGTDNPFAPMFPSTNTSAPQRTQNIAKAKQLLQAAGHSSFTATLATEQFEEVPQLAQVIAQSAAKIGVKINLKAETQSQYYGKATFGNSDWLDAEISLVDYGDRGVPNVFLESPLVTGGSWNAAHFSNKTYDNLVKQYVAAVDLQAQKQIAGKIEQLLLDQTPLIIPYFLDGLTASTPKVHGLNPTATQQIFLKDAYMSG
ncbi:MAG: ABC transporter substrate-binding protein [Pseudonocardiaceae bacterium]